MTARLMQAVNVRILVLVAALVFLGCGGAPESTKYQQTWTKAYSDTTCEDWRSTMTEHEKFVMAADILYTEQKKLKSDIAIPDDALIGQFQGQIQGLCLTNPADDVTTAAFIVWTTADDVFQPE